MMIKKDLVLAVLCTFCLTATLFTAVTRTSSSSKPYDPWMDYLDDGRIDIHDLVYLISIYESFGEPINKTAILYQLQARINSLNTSLLNLEAYLNTRIVTLNASLLDLEAYLTTRMTNLEALVAEQQSRIAELESEIAVLNATKLGKPDWDSGWFSIPAGETRVKNHDLNTTNVLVYMIGYDYNGYEYHQINYGGDSNGGTNLGAWWCKLTETTIEIWRHASDQRWDLTRVMIWKIP
jgi:hypothetical protein